MISPLPFRTWFLFTSALCLAAPLVRAAEEPAASPIAAADKPAAVCPICGRANQPSLPYAEKAGSTLIRGATNTLFGWTELIRQPTNEAKAGGNILAGIANGAGHTVGRTMAGLGEILTFWTPKVNNEYVHFATDCPLCMKSPASPTAALDTAAPAR